MTTTKPKSKHQNLTERIAKHIERSPKFFKDGTSITATQFRKRFSRFSSLPKLALGTHLQYVAMQVTVNKLLNLRGLRIESKDNYSRWNVVYDTTYPKKQLKAALNLQRASARLDRGQYMHQGIITAFTEDEKYDTQKHIRSNRVVPY